MIDPGGTAIRPSTGDFHGRPTLRLANGAIVVDVLATAGPRIVGLRRDAAAPNLLAETPDLGWETPAGRFELFGGHRLWLAPEDPERVEVPDSGGLTVEALPDGVRLVGAPELATGCVRTIEVRLHPALPVMDVLHRVCNEGVAPVELSPWAITQLPLDGIAVLPQERAAAGHRTQPNRNVVLWPYASWEDPRLRVRDGLVAVAAVAGPDLKVGTLDAIGWVAYARGGTALVRRFTPEPDATHPDLHCNVEVFCGQHFLELEVLGPLRTLAPGMSTTLTERWEVRAAADDGALTLRDDLARPMEGMTC